MVCMKKSVLCLVFLLVLLACAPATKETQTTGTNFRYGTEGLGLSFVPNLPPARMYDGGPFEVVVQVENKGTEDAVSPDFYLSGFDHSIITGIKKDATVIDLLKGRSQFMPKGEMDTAAFSGTIPPLINVDKYNPTLLVTACYMYSTTANAQICIDPNPYSPTKIQKVCAPSPVSLGSQGAPIAVTGVEVDAAPGTTRFRINVQNAGNGDVFRTGALADCNPYSAGLSFNDVDFVNVAAVYVSGTNIINSCKPLDSEGHLRLSNGAGSFFCELSGIQGQSAYLTPLNIVLAYSYRQTISMPIEILHVVR
jgi:hypothetical protein